MYTDAPVAQKKLELDVSLQAAAQRRLKVLASKRKTAAKSADPHVSLTAEPPSATKPAKPQLASEVAAQARIQDALEAKKATGSRLGTDRVEAARLKRQAERDAAVVAALAEAEKDREAVERHAQTVAGVSERASDVGGSSRLSAAAQRRAEAESSAKKPKRTPQMKDSPATETKLDTGKRLGTDRVEAAAQRRLQAELDAVSAAKDAIEAKERAAAAAYEANQAKKRASAAQLGDDRVAAAKARREAADAALREKILSSSKDDVMTSPGAEAAREKAALYGTERVALAQDRRAVADRDTRDAVKEGLVNKLTAARAAYQSALDARKAAASKFADERVEAARQRREQAEAALRTHVEAKANADVTSPRSLAVKQKAATLGSERVLAAAQRREDAEKSAAEAARQALEVKEQAALEAYRARLAEKQETAERLGAERVEAARAKREAARQALRAQVDEKLSEERASSRAVAAKEKAAALGGDRVVAAAQRRLQAEVESAQATRVALEAKVASAQAAYDAQLAKKRENAARLGEERVAAAKARRDAAEAARQSVSPSKDDGLTSPGVEQARNKAIHYGTERVNAAASRRLQAQLDAAEDMRQSLEAKEEAAKAQYRAQLAARIAAAERLGEQRVEAAKARRDESGKAVASKWDELKAKEEASSKLAAEVLARRREAAIALGVLRLEAAAQRRKSELDNAPAQAREALEAIERKLSDSERRHKAVLDDKAATAAKLGEDRVKAAASRMQSQVEALQSASDQRLAEAEARRAAYLERKRLAGLKVEDRLEAVGERRDFLASERSAQAAAELARRHSEAEARLQAQIDSKVATARTLGDDRVAAVHAKREAAGVPAPKGVAPPLSPNTSRKLQAAAARRQAQLEEKVAKANLFADDRVSAAQERLKIASDKSFDATRLELAEQRRKAILEERIENAARLGQLRVEASKARLSAADVSAAMQALRTAMGLSTAAERRAQNLQSVKDKAAALAQPKLSPELSQPYPAVVDADIVRSPSLEAATARRNALLAERQRKAVEMTVPRSPAKDTFDSVDVYASVAEARLRRESELSSRQTRAAELGRLRVERVLHRAEEERKQRLRDIEASLDAAAQRRMLAQTTRSAYQQPSVKL